MPPFGVPESDLGVPLLVAGPLEEHPERHVAIRSPRDQRRSGMMDGRHNSATRPSRYRRVLHLESPRRACGALSASSPAFPSDPSAPQVEVAVTKLREIRVNERSFTQNRARPPSWGRAAERGGRTRGAARPSRYWRRWADCRAATPTRELFAARPGARRHKDALSGSRAELVEIV